MASIINSPADVVNLALVRIGSKWLIGNIYDGSEPAQLAIAIYGQTRDEMLRKLTPGFAQRELPLALLKQAPDGGYVANPWSTQYPQLPWTFQYAYPDDCLILGSIRSTPLFIPNYDPQPNTFAIANDSSVTPQVKVVLTDVAGAVGTYTAQVTDPTLWESDFIEAFAAELGRRLAPALVGLEQAKAEVADGQSEMAADRASQG